MKIKGEEGERRGEKEDTLRMLSIDMINCEY